MRTYYNVLKYFLKVFNNTDISFIYIFIKWPYHNIKIRLKRTEQNNGKYSPFIIPIWNVFSSQIGSFMKDS